MTKKAKLRKQADRLWYEKAMEGYEDSVGATKCMACDNNAQQIHHFYYKSSYSHLRYDMDNATPLCMHCHFLLHHQDPKKIEELIVAERGKKWNNRLKNKANKRPLQGYLTIKYYEDIIKNLS